MKFWCYAQSKDYGFILDNGKQAGKVKGFKMNAETEEKMTNKQRIKLIKGAVNNVDINYNLFDIKNCKIVTKHMVKQWAFKFDKRMIRTISENEIDTLQKDDARDTFHDVDKALEFYNQTHPDGEIVLPYRPVLEDFYKPTPEHNYYETVVAFIIVGSSGYVAYRFIV